MLRGQLTRHTAALAVGAFLLGACSGSTAATDDPTGPEIGFEVSESPSVAEDPWAAPDPLTEEYVIRVLTEIEAEKAGFWRWLQTADPGDDLPSGVADHVHRSFTAISSQAYLDQVLQAFEERGDVDYLVDPYGQYRPGELTLHRADPECPLIEVLWDASTVEGPGTPAARGREFLTLGPQKAGALVNETGWVYTRIFLAEEITSADIDRELETRSMCS